MFSLDLSHILDLFSFEGWGALYSAPLLLYHPPAVYEGLTLFFPFPLACLVAHGLTLARNRRRAIYRCKSSLDDDPHTTNDERVWAAQREHKAEGERSIEG